MHIEIFRPMSPLEIEKPFARSQEGEDRDQNRYEALLEETGAIEVVASYPPGERVNIVCGLMKEALFRSKTCAALAIQQDIDPASREGHLCDADWFRLVFGALAYLRERLLRQETKATPLAIAVGGNGSAGIETVAAGTSAGPRKARQTALARREPGNAGATPFRSGLGAKAQDAAPFRFTSEPGTDAGARAATSGRGKIDWLQHCAAMDRTRTGTQSGPRPDVGQTQHPDGPAG